MDLHSVNVRVADCISDLSGVDPAHLGCHILKVLLRGKIRKEVDESCDPLRYGFGRNNEDLLIFHEALCLFCGKNDILVVWKDVDHVRIYLLDGI